MSKKKDPGAVAGATGAGHDAAGQQPDLFIKSEIAAPAADEASGENWTNGASPDGSASPTPNHHTGDAAEIARLAALPVLEYDRMRASAAERSECRVATLDRLVEAARSAHAAPDSVDPERAQSDTLGRGRALVLTDIEPWPCPVDGAALLNALATTIRDYVIISPVQADAIALWVVHTHAFEAADVTPKLVAKSAVMRSGKSRLAEVLERTVARPCLVAGGIRSAALLRIIQLHVPTLLLNEVDALMNGNLELSESAARYNEFRF